LLKIIHYDCKSYKPNLSKEDYFINQKIDNSASQIVNPLPVQVGARMFENRSALERGTESHAFTSNNSPQKLNLKENVVENDLQQSHSNIQSKDHSVAVNNFIEDDISSKKDSLEEKDKKISVSITMQDYHSLTLKESIKFDKRTFKAYLADNIIENHKIINLIFKKSLLHPLFIRINELIFDLSLTFAINALLFSDNYIDARANDPHKVKTFNKIE
jgi:hypothetical protein